MSYDRVVYSQAEYDAKYGCCDSNLFIDYVKCSDNRFHEICDLYLRCLTLEDIEFMKPEDFICLVPEEQYNHKLLMTILARRYLYNEDDEFNDEIGDMIKSKKKKCKNKCNDCSDSDCDEKPCKDKCYKVTVGCGCNKSKYH